ncbi:MAG: helix-turn-helix domain-containing protein [Emergencia sp.]
MNDRLKYTGLKIRTYRLALGMSLGEFAEKIHKSKATVSKYENGLISIDLGTLLDICDILDIPPGKLLPPLKDNAGKERQGEFQSRQYLYSYARKGRRLTRSILDHYYGDEDRLGVTFYYDVPAFDQPEKCRGLYEGSMCKEGTILNYQFVNRRNSTEHTFLCCLESLVNDGYNMGLLSSISYDTMTPNAIKVILSPVQLKENDELKELLLFDKEDIQRLKRDNMLTVVRK